MHITAMKNVYFLFIIGCISCNQPKDASKAVVDRSAKDYIKTEIKNVDSTILPHNTTKENYSNERFKNVSIKRLSEHEFEISGQAQVFEAAFSWVIEDGHHELAKGHAMTDAGAPRWGNFNFKAEAKKANPNTVLHLILFEASAKDGSRQHELSVPLY